MKRTLFAGAVLTGLSVASAILLVLFSGCAAALSALDIRNPSYSIQNVRPRVAVAIPLSASTIDLDLDLAVDNPNRVGLRLDQVDFNLLINNRQVLDTVSAQDVRIPANGRGNVLLRTRIGYDSIRSIWSEIVDVVRGNNARYEVRGTAHYDTPAGRLSFPLTVYSSP